MDADLLNRVARDPSLAKELLSRLEVERSHHEAEIDRLRIEKHALARYVATHSGVANTSVVRGTDSRRMSNSSFHNPSSVVSTGALRTAVDLLAGTVGASMEESSSSRVGHPPRTYVVSNNNASEPPEWVKRVESSIARLEARLDRSGLARTSFDEHTPILSANTTPPKTGDRRSSVVLSGAAILPAVNKGTFSTGSLQETLIPEVEKVFASALTGVMHEMTSQLTALDSGVRDVSAQVNNALDAKLKSLEDNQAHMASALKNFERVQSTLQSTLTEATQKIEAKIEDLSHSVNSNIDSNIVQRKQEMVKEIAQTMNKVIQESSQLTTMNISETIVKSFSMEMAQLQKRLWESEKNA